MKKKHILFIVENNPFPGDIRVKREARAAYQFGYDVSVIAPKGKTIQRLPYENYGGIEVYRHPMPLEGGSKLGLISEYINAIIWEFLLCLKIYLKKPFHVIHAANPPDHVFLIALFFKLFRVRYVFDHHDISPENYIAKFGRKDFLFKFLLLFEKFTFLTADLIISTNQSYKKIAVTRGKRREEEVFVVRNGPDLTDVEYSPPNPAYKAGFTYLVGYVGTIGNQEGIDNLLQSIRYLVYEKQIKNIRYIIVGSGTHLQNLINLAAELQISDYVHFTGYIPYKQYWEVINSCDLCVNPEFKNPFTNHSTMLKIMDYMVMHKPVLQYHTLEGQRTAEDAGVYIHQNDPSLFADELVNLLHDPARRQQLSRAAKERMENVLQWEHQKVHLKRAYNYLFLDYKRKEWKKRISRIRTYYYFIKPILARKTQLCIRKWRINLIREKSREIWPVFAKAMPKPPPGWQGWPEQKQFALVLSHDVETLAGCQKMDYFIELEKKYGFRSAFYFVPDRYDSTPWHSQLKAEGFEIGIQGLKHDGKLYFSEKTFLQRAARINQYLKAWGACGFRSPCMHHNLEWIMKLDLLYDASTYDTDPFEPLGNGLRNIFPVILKNETKTIVELPYTLPQDHLLFILMQEKNIRLWKRKVDWIVDQGGMIFFITHPDYLLDNRVVKTAYKRFYPGEFYEELLVYIMEKYQNQYWHALPREMAHFWNDNYPENSFDVMTYLWD